MKKLIIGLFAASAMVPTVGFAAANPDSNGVNKNCFGQGRSGYSSTAPADAKTGSIISDRAQTESTNPDYPNQNVQLNKEYKDACQAAPAP